MATIDYEREVRIAAGSVTLEGTMVLPEATEAVVVFAHGSGSSRHSPRNRFVAEVLQEEGIGTLLFDLLTREEDQVYETRFNIALLTDRLKAATQWVKGQPQSRELSLGFFGASTGAASALWAAADLGDAVGAVVSRGGRPDMAGPVLGHVTAPTMLIVGGRDYGVIELNEKAYALIKAPKKLEIIAGATHLFEEPGALEQVSAAAAQWFVRHLTSGERRSAA